MFCALALVAPVLQAQDDDDDPSDAGATTEAQAPRTLTEAARDGNIAAARAMLARGVGVNTRFFGQHTALMAAAAYGETEMVRFLLTRGANPLLRDAEGRTASVRARDNKYSALANLLDKAARSKVPPRVATTPARPAIAPVKQRRRVTIAPVKQRPRVTTASAQPPAPGRSSQSSAELIDTWWWGTAIMSTPEKNITNHLAGELILRPDGTYYSDRMIGTLYSGSEGRYSLTGDRLTLIDKSGGTRFRGTFYIGRVTDPTGKVYKALTLKSSVSTIVYGLTERVK
jgi:hypothetical protein